MTILWGRGVRRLLVLIGVAYCLGLAIFAGLAYQRLEYADYQIRYLSERLSCVAPFTGRDLDYLDRVAGLSGVKLSSTHERMVRYWMDRKAIYNAKSAYEMREIRARIDLRTASDWATPIVLLAIIAAILWIWRGFRPIARGAPSTAVSIDQSG